MQTKYGDISTEQYIKYRNSLVNRIYAILPMKEENNITLEDYVDCLNRELMQNLHIFEHSEHVVSVVCLLSGVVNEIDHKKYRKEILRCCNIISRLGDDNV